MTLNGNYTRVFASDENSLLSKISGITNACDRSKKLMVSIYHIEKDRFIFCNKSFKKKIGCNNSDLLLKKGWDFWFSMVDSSESLRIKNRVLRFFSAYEFKKTLVLRYHITNFCNKKKYVRHEILFFKLEEQIIAINYFFDISDKEKIERSIKVNEDSCDTIFSKGKVIISPREEEVLQLIADGFSSKEIAEQLFISNHTAISHRKNLIEKFDVKNTAQLIKEASKIIEL